MKRRAKMLIQMRRVFFLAAMLGIPNLYAATVVGTIYDASTRQPLPGINVFIEQNHTIGAAADLEGYFRIVNLPTGKWTLSASGMGYGKVSQEITIADEKGEYTVDFGMYPTVLRGNEVIVTATREPRVLKELPVRTEIITRDDIELKGALDLYQALEGQPGVRVEQQCSNCNFSMLRVEGLEGGYAEILIDGQPVFTGLAGVYGLQQLMSSNIDQIEIIKGAGSALYGAGALGGVFNIKTKEPDPIPRIKLGFIAGEDETYSMNFDGTMRKGNFAVAYAFQVDTKGAIDQTGNTDPDFVDNNDYEDAGPDGFTDRVMSDNYGVVLKAFLLEPIGEGSKLILTGRTLGEFRKGGFIENFDDPFDLDAEHIRTNRYVGGASYIHDFARGNHLECNLTYVDHYRSATNGAAWDKAIDAGMLDDDLDLTPAGQETLDIIGMAEFDSRYFPEPFIAAENLYLVDVMFSHPVFMAGDAMAGAQYRRSEIEQDINGAIIKDSKQADDFGIFVQLDIYPFTEKFELITGARYDIHDSQDDLAGIEYNESVFNPRVAARYFLSRNVTLRGSFGSGFRVPYLFSEDLHLCASSPRIYKGSDLKPEKASSFSLGTDYMTSGIEMGIGFFYTKISDKVEFIEPGGGDVPTGFDFRWANVGEATTIGSEVFSRGSPLSWLSYNVNAVYTNARFDEKRDPDIENSDRIPRSPDFTAYGEMVFRIGRANLSASANFTGSMFIDHVPEEDEANYILEKTVPFATLNARIGYRINRFVELQLVAKNLFGYTQPTRDITDAAYMYAPLVGRQISGGITINL